MAIRDRWKETALGLTEPRAYKACRQDRADSDASAKEGPRGLGIARSCAASSRRASMASLGVGYTGGAWSRLPEPAPSLPRCMTLDKTGPSRFRLPRRRAALQSGKEA